ncbi:SAM-dependent DNA methyltransferase [Cryobacterium sp. TMT2-10]|uniref:type I restriction-modification system subunit M n=1 Tax=Cryobacterium sp. TMT2-10 TaxID=1259244 RepID=UPI001068F934|nr:class I SAM-dependent DNA methyltransferase [Cryobacterium sp. TMT2-10]TFD36623.1 SAM-dependent DNA methyltransferase [Cryobacterium sp. TMT2-10]
MVTGELKSQIDKVWKAFWTGGIANPVEIIEQITYLLFIKRLDELHTKEENKANRLGVAIENRVFPEGDDDAARTPRPYNDLRWSVFANRDSTEMFEILGQHVFPFLQQLGKAGSSYARNMKDARFTIPTAALLVKVVDLLNDIPMDDRDTKGDVYEYMLSQLATAGTNGQFRTPRHIIKLMVDMSAPTPDDTIIDPAAGTAGFLMMAGEYLHDHHPEIWADKAQRDHYNQEAFTGYDSDAAMARIGSMNLLLHGVENPTMERADSLAETHPKTESYSLVLANPPFAGSLDYETTAKDLLQVVKTKKTELLFLALTLRLLKNGGRAAVIVPDGVLSGSTNAHRELRRMIVEDQKLDAVVKLPSGVFRPYTGVSTAILFFTKTSSGGTQSVWFYDVQADGFSLDDKRTELDPTVYEQDNLADVLLRWKTLTSDPAIEGDRPRTAQSFLVTKAEIASQGYDLSLNRYKEVQQDVVLHRSPSEILGDISALEVDIAAGLGVLRHSLGVGE